MTSLVSHTSELHRLADSIDCKIVPALTGSTSVFVIGLAVTDVTVSIVKRIRLNAFFADIIDLILASKNRILGTEIVD